MIGESVLTLREIIMREPLPLAKIQDAVLEFLKGRDDAVVFGAQAALMPVPLATIVLWNTSRFWFRPPSCCWKFTE